jgi:hypothetical protein
VDRSPLTRLVELAVTVSDNPRLLAELRQLEDRFGLSPHARKVLAWQVEEPKPSESKPAAPRTDRAAVMKVLAGGAA